MPRLLKPALIALALLSGPSFGQTYTFAFLANPGADRLAPADKNLDITFTVTLTTKFLPTISIASLNESTYWHNGGITVRMEHDGASSVLNDALVSTSGPLKVDSGVIEIYPHLNEFFDVDFHSDSSFVNSNRLSFDAFVYGQIDAYNDQIAFRDLFDIASGRDASALARYVTAVPEPGAASMFLAGLAGVLGVATRKRRRGRKECY
ncbi:MAG: PEP-CTERM sorting domain-containing protein [Zoogloeaceae bacterium]|nr:PEP-CTERM sorting domain-containing protein [Zoogloeaceae bacterium]